MNILVTTIAALLASAGLSPAAPPAPLDGALGANFNEHYEDVDFAQLRRANDHWIRGFLPMPQVDLGNPGAHPAIATTLEAERQGFATILTLKFPMKKTGIPRAGTPAFERALSAVDAVLPLTVGKVDILEIGNEPFIESPKSQQNRVLNDFYEAMARRVIAYRAQHCPGACRTRLFMGALNRLNNPAWRTAATDRWLAFVRETPEIAGVDIHPHIRSLDESKAFLDYVLPRLRPDQKFIATEFSLVWYWRQHLDDLVPASFAARYDVPANTKIWQEIAEAIAKPVPQREWDDLLTASPWFSAQRNYLADQVAMFRRTGRLAVATYGFKQGGSMTRRFGPDSVPWLLNSVIASRTVRPAADGKAGTNPYWFDAFRILTVPPASSATN
ncbi:MAG TPA: hypothetical protein VFT56_17050 [Sphingomonas sp.]|nr:hypothetical protein [Sphingomonas sp.]